MPLNLTIRNTTSNDFANIMGIHVRGFGSANEASLTATLLDDISAKPVISLLALYGNEPVGHILFTRMRLDSKDDPLLHILAPLAVTPEYKRQGVGGMLIRAGLEELRAIGSQMVFVLGHKEYYPRHGFMPHAMRHGYQPPHPIPEENSVYWMFQPLTPEAAHIEKGTLRCATALNNPAHWRECQRTGED